MKFCSKCKRNLPESEFYRREHGWLFSHCKSCVAQMGAALYKAYKDRKLKYGKAYYQLNREKILARCFHYRHTHPCKKRHRKTDLQWLKNWKINQRKFNIQFVIREKLRKRIWSYLKRVGISKQGTTISILGCSVKDFQKHIERLWHSGMTWDNHGKLWHIDHIRPLASFDLRSLEQQQKAFHFLNTQPLTVLENLSKKDKWNFQDSIMKK